MLYYLALLLPCFTCLAWAMILIAKWRINNNAQNIVAITLLLLAFCALSLSDLLVQTNNLTWGYIQNAIHTSMATLIFPLFVRYFRLLTNGSKLKWWNNLIFVPAILTAIVIIITHIGMGHDLSVSYARDYLYNEDSLPNTANDWLNFRISLLNLVSVLLFIQELYLIVYAFVCLRRYDHNLNNFYSNNDDKRMAINYILLISLIVYFILMAVSIMLPIEIFKTHPALTIALMMAFAVALNVLAYCVYRARHTTADMAALAEQIDLEVGPVELNAQNDSRQRGYPSSLPTKFNKLIDDEKIFLQPNLSIDYVCRRLSTNRRHICPMIDDVYRMTFFDYINSRRVEYAKALLTAEPDIDEKTLAQRTGFLHVSAFCRIFKQHTGVALTNWRKNNTTKS